jgi:hypothetical protein
MAIGDGGLDHRKLRKKGTTALETERKLLEIWDEATE